MNESQLEQALWEYLNEAPMYVKAKADRYKAAQAVFEQTLLRHALKRTGGVKLRAAKLLGINRNTLNKRYYRNKGSTSAIPLATT